MDFSRQREVFEPSTFKHPVHIIGCGATGSWVALTLAKMGVHNLHLWDFDKVEEHNLPNQAYRWQDIGEYKVDALASIITEHTGYVPKRHVEAVTSRTKLVGIVFLLTDTMSSRKEIFEGAIKYNMSIPLMVETRMGLESYIIHTADPVRKGDIEAFEGTLHSDEQASTSVCGTSQSLIATAMITASKAVWCMINFVRGEQNPVRQVMDVGRNTMLEMGREEW